MYQTMHNIFCSISFTGTCMNLAFTPPVIALPFIINYGCHGLLRFASWSYFRTHVQGQVDIGDLTWEQKEKVLRFLFAKMNHTEPKRGKFAQASNQSMQPGETGDAW